VGGRRLTVASLGETCTTEGPGSRFGSVASARPIDAVSLLLACAAAAGAFLACGGGVSGGSPDPDAGSFDRAAGDTTAALEDSATDAWHSSIPDASTDIADLLRDATPDGPGMDAAGGDGASRVPANHRVSGTMCPVQRGTGSTDGLTPGDCDADTNCTTGTTGRCLPSCGPPGCFASDCSYDGCFSDSDCGGRVPCACRPSATSSAPNSCIRGSTCAVDSDCGPGGYCSPSGASEWCGARYHCHTTSDACLDDSDCPSGGGCNFQGMLGHWACGFVCGPPPP
jgi:hypothetical protein